MKMGEPAFITVNLVLDNKTIAVPYNSTTTAEDVCIYVCKQLNIGSLTRHLFALRVTGKSIFLMPAATFGGKGATVDFRIRFKVANIAKVAKIDINTYNYYFHQVRSDVLDNKIPDIVYEKYRSELIGLGITDMYRVMLEKDISRETVENDYKKYIPKEVLKRHPFFIRKPIHDTLGNLQKSVHEASYVKAQYLRQLSIIAPEYLSESYKAVILQNGADFSVVIKLSPSDPSELVFRYSTESKKDPWQVICTMEELSFISMKNDTIEICRKNGIPFYVRFISVPVMYSFISLLDGYYRLTCKWTFNICSEVYTPSLQKLYAMKCHGPVGGEFSYAKLEAKRGNRAGCFIIRESESKYNHYYIDICMKEGLKPKTFKLERIMGDEFIFNDDLIRYKSIKQLMAAYNDPNGAIYLQECLPPSEYDVSPLLLCRDDTIVGDSLTDSSALNVLMPTSPMCINSKNLQVYKGSWCYTTDPEIVQDACNVRDCDKPEECIIIVGAFLMDRKMYILPQWKEAGLHGGLRFAIKEWNPDILDGLDISITPKSGSDLIRLQIGANYNEKIVLYHNGRVIEEKTLPHIISAGQRKEGSRGITAVFRSMWKITKGKKIEVAMKMLNQEFSDRYLKDFLTLAGQWAFLQSSAVVRLYGIAFTSNVSLVLEYFRLGPLDQYLRGHRGIIKTVDLVEAASNLASALWHLTENNIVHGNIRCRKLMVNSHDDNSFTVKLTDPGIHTSYASSEVHWIPIECYSNLDYAKRSIEADVWSFGTTLWEMFTFGDEIKLADHGQTMRWYISGKRLPQPPTCPTEIYSLMKECWDIDPHKRKKPQALSRDINQILYQVYDSRQNHRYAKVNNKPNGVGASRNSLQSTNTESTMVTEAEHLISVSDVESDISGMSSFAGDESQNWLMNSPHLVNYDYSDPSSLPSFWSHINLSTATTSLDSLNSMQSVFELDGNYYVVLQGRIGQGFYGEVYKGTLESVDGQNEEPRKVAVKKLKATALSSCLQDFEREINIMKSLKHPNIVEILGVLREPEISLVMEFVHHGSLQSYLKINKESLQEEQLLKYALDIAKGMHYLGTKNIVHRDLAARNILVVDDNHVKISDFGLAQVMGTNDYYILKTPNRELPIKWYAPESLRDGKFSVRSDVWSYGVTMCETFNYGDEPKLANIDDEIEGQQQQQVLLTALEKGARFPCPPHCPKSVYIRIIYPCWQADPHKRPLFVQLTLEIEDLLTQY